MQGSTTRGEEIANCLTHGVGLVLSVVGLVVGIMWTAETGDPWVITSVAVYTTTLVLLYAASTAYHAAPSGRWKKALRTCDHAAIFLLIAGTYTPFMLVNLRGPWGWSMLAVVWTLAIAGVGFKAAFTGRFNLVSSLLYVALGWAVLVALKPLLAHVSTAGLTLLVGGGICYTVGVVFYLWHGLRYHHAVWHLFVLAGSALHYFAVMRSVT
ncbi:MAG: hemolysin III family protein [Verrucomicrobia bacterium]|nr:MAG: hemolysin III family protein [Verrucomicrobiota bacterium]